MIRLVTFDALHTIIRPRLPVYVQYSQTFAPYLGTLDPDRLKQSFKAALKELQTSKPLYESGAEGWWGEVIKRTALGAGANSKAVDASLPEIVPRLMKRFSSSEGYALFADTLSTIQNLREENITTGVITNADMRIVSVMESLSLGHLLDPVLVSEQEGVEKPAKDIFLRACARAEVRPHEALHVGDELDADFHGATKAGLHALLLRRSGPEGEEARKEPEEDLEGVVVVESLYEVVQWVKQHGGAQPPPL
ncbi:HAD-like protein [Punctularia strigosozonata HHB-11173 SS5]|uniref:HAD-like protein n=1 Tax=Punctularia strigosozonata (strain HHB-11173) TaxID=741275 RepID=UPI0004417542|nr:HAD-like protein [Punctularia strigosozonata HHB-11173 SS5]EIN12034.1 HAD-like protein [Punctularia strigosozonata HHB-11173 SS5]